MSIAIISISILLTILSSILYRAGGQGSNPMSNPKWMPMWIRNKGIRTIGCTMLTIALAFVMLPRVSWWWYVIAFVAQYGATTTYFDDAPKWINWMKPKDNFVLHGLFIRLAILFIAIPAGLWWQCLVSAVVLGGFMGIWCALFGNDVVEEFGRGGSIIATLPLLLI